MLAKVMLLTVSLLQPLPTSPPSIALPLPDTGFLATSVRTLPWFRPLGGKQLYERVFALIEQNRWQEARALRRWGQRPLLNKFILWLDIRRPVRHDFDTIAAFIQTNPHWPEPELLQRRAEEAMTEAIPAQRVLDWFAHRQPLTTDGHIRLVAALRRSGQLAAATHLARETWVQQVFGPAQARRFLETQGDLLRPEDHWGRVDRLLWEGHINAARGLLERVDEAHRTLAQARIGLRSFDHRVDALINAVPHHLQNDPGLLYERFRWRHRQGRYHSAVEFLATVPRPLAYGEHWWPEIEALIRHAMEQHDYATAHRLAADHGQREPRPAAEGDWLAGWLALRHLGRPDQALAHFHDLYRRVSYPVSKARGAYWAARSLQALGRDAEARHWFQRAANHRETFYGQQAASHLRLAPQPVPHSPRPSDIQVAAFQEHELVRTIQALLEFELIDYTQPLLQRLGELAQAQDDPALLSLTARLTTRLDRLEWLVRIGKQRGREGFMVHDAAFPLLALVDQAVDTHTDLVHAIIRQESLFDTRARSHAGASGLMQLMPRTAQAVAEMLELDYDRHRLLDDPHYNIRLGHAYITRMLERWDGNYILAIASYNAGPTRVQEWVERLGDPRDWDVDPIDWVESIPFEETRNYVQRVMENLTVYRSRLQRLELANL